MCGIIGIWSKNNLEQQEITALQNGLDAINHRGPDYQDCKLHSNAGFGHARLSIIDTNERANQPFTAANERYSLVFNGEIYNFVALRNELIKEGYAFSTESDTEVLLNLLTYKGKAAIDLLDGFFAFCLYDKQEDTLLLARDRAGIKPLLIYTDESRFCFASEMRGLLDFVSPKKINATGLNQYFGFTYTIAPTTIFEKVIAIKPGHLVEVVNGEATISTYYQPVSKIYTDNYNAAKKEIREQLTASVKNRMIADVPLGCFLSGGLDSSIIAALAMQQQPLLKTFSVGFDHPFFNETEYANDVAKHIGSNHTVYTLTKDDFKTNFHDFLDALDTPFADSSAFAVYLLAQKTSKEVTVALSGDGADELFGGYRKHFAEFKTRAYNPIKRNGIKLMASSLARLKENRSSRLGDLNRKLQKMGSGLKMKPAQRYWNWCQFIREKDRKLLFKNLFQENAITLDKSNWKDLNAVLLADQAIVLPNDMLKKVDLMSMANGLEVRTPFLSHHLTEFVNSLPANFKVNAKGGKQILKDAFADLLPNSVLNRSKKGFEIPIKEWLNDELITIFEGDLFTKAFITEQALFNYDFIQDLKVNWKQPNFGDRIYLVWALIVFQHWWNRTLKTDKIV